MQNVNTDQLSMSIDCTIMEVNLLILFEIVMGPTLDSSPYILVA